MGSGDTWKEFRRGLRKSVDMYCEVIESGDTGPIQGTAYQNGKQVTVALSVENIAAIRLTSGPTDDGLIIDLELALFSLLLCELDGIPVARHVRHATTGPDGMMTSALAAVLRGAAAARLSEGRRRCGASVGSARGSAVRLHGFL